ARAVAAAVVPTVTRGRASRERRVLDAGQDRGRPGHRGTGADPVQHLSTRDAVSDLIRVHVLPQLDQLWAYPQSGCGRITQALDFFYVGVPEFTFVHEEGCRGGPGSSNVASVRALISQ